MQRQEKGSLMHTNSAPNDDPSHVQTIEWLKDVARGEKRQDPKVLCQAVRNELSQTAIYTRQSEKNSRVESAVRVVRVESCADTKCVVVVVAHQGNGREEKIPFLAFFQLYKIAIVR